MTLKAKDLAEIAALLHPENEVYLVDKHKRQPTPIIGYSVVPNENKELELWIKADFNFVEEDYEEGSVIDGEVLDAAESDGDFDLDSPYALDPDTCEVIGEVLCNLRSEDFRHTPPHEEKDCVPTHPACIYA